jgi:hypothetical protein
MLCCSDKTAWARSHSLGLPFSLNAGNCRSESRPELRDDSRGSSLVGIENKFDTSRTFHDLANIRWESDSLSESGINLRLDIYRPRLFGFRSLAEFFVKLMNSLTKRESRLRGFAGGQITDSCLSASTGSGNLRLSNAEGLKIGNDFFKAHAETITVIRYYVKRFFDTRF